MPKSIIDDACRAALITRIDKLNADSKAAWGRMNVEQMMSHLVQVGELPWLASCGDRSTFMSRNVIKPLALYLLAMPKELKTAPDVDQQEAGRKPVGLDADRESLKNAIEKLAALPLDHDCLPHPFFGKLSTREWGLLSHKHIDHHLRQFGV